MSEHTDYGTRLKRLRRERGLTAAELAAAVNDLAGGVVTSRDAVTRAENHIRRRVPLAEAVLAARVLRVGSERLLFVGDDPRAESPFFEYRGMSNRRARAAWRGGDGGRPVRVGGGAGCGRRMPIMMWCGLIRTTMRFWRGTGAWRMRCAG